MLNVKFSFKNNQLKYKPNIGIKKDTCDINTNPLSNISLALIINAMAVLKIPR